MDEMVSESNVSCQLILVRVCTWKTLNLGDFMLSLGGGTCG